MQTGKTEAALISVDFVRHYWTTMRPYLLFVSGITGIVGLSYAPSLSIYATIILMGVFFFSYGFGQALTDCFQIDTDSLSSPYRPLTQGVIAKKDVLIVSITGLLLIGLILAFFDVRNLILCLIAILGLASYTYFKKRWWAGPFYNAWIVSLLCLIAFIAGGGDVSSSDTSLYLLLLAVLFGYANFVLSGYFKDISADRATGYRTLPVVFSLTISKIISDLFALLTLIFCLIILEEKISRESFNISLLSSIIFFLSAVIVSVTAQIKLHKVNDEKDAHHPIALVVHTYILLLTSITMIQKPSWTLFLWLFYAGFIITLKFRPMKEQI